MKWQDMYEVALERIRQLNREVALLGNILRAYLPVIEKDEDEKR